MPFRKGQTQPLAAEARRLRSRLLESLADPIKLRNLEAWLWRWAKQTKNAPVALAAITELLNRTVGKAEESHNITISAGREAMTAERAYEILTSASVPEDAWPATVKLFAESRRKQIESKVVE